MFAKEEHKSFHDVSFVIYGHQTWNLEGQIEGPPSVSWFLTTPARRDKFNQCFSPSLFHKQNYLNRIIYFASTIGLYNILFVHSILAREWGGGMRPGPHSWTHGCLPPPPSSGQAQIRNQSHVRFHSKTVQMCSELL